MRYWILFLFLTSLFFVPFTSVFATLGVGVGTGKIIVEEQLKPGTIYQLPSFTVINTGDEPGDYAISLQYHEKQTELRPEQTWFTFSPATFHLKPKEVKTVDVKLHLPLQAKPGSYFAYLEAHPVKKSVRGETAISIAAASKLYFTVVAANIFQAVYYKIVTFWQVYAPWTHWAAIIFAILIVAFLFRRFFHIQIQVKKSQKIHDRDP